MVSAVAPPIGYIFGRAERQEENLVALITACLCGKALWRRRAGPEDGPSGPCGKDESPAGGMDKVVAGLGPEIDR